MKVIFPLFFERAKREREGETLSDSSRFLFLFHVQASRNLLLLLLFLTELGGKEGQVSENAGYGSAVAVEIGGKVDGIQGKWRWRCRGGGKKVSLKNEKKGGSGFLCTLSKARVSSSSKLSRV